MREPRERICDMLEAITGIERHTDGGREAFDADELVQVYVVHQLQIAGEAAYQLPKDVHRRHPEVPWSKIVGMRHILVHGYFRLDLDIVWSVVEKDLRGLKAQLEAILAEMGDGT